MEIKAPREGEHATAVSELFARTFSDYWSWLSHAENGYIVDGPLDWNASRAGFVDGELATFFGVWDLRMRVGRAELRVAAIGSVATDKPDRKKGLMRETAEACIAGLADAGYDVSLLFGIPNFYHHFGYHGCFPDETITLRTADIAAVERTTDYEEIEDVRRALRDELAALYNEENASVTGTYVRPTFTRNTRPKEYRFYRFDGGYVLCGSQEDSDILTVADCAGEPAGILEIVRRRALAELCPEIHFSYLPLRSRMGGYLSRRTHKRLTRVRELGGPMMRVVRLKHTMELLASELERRISGGPMRGYSGGLELSDSREAVRLELSAGAIESVETISKAGQLGKGERDRAQASARIEAGIALPRLLIGDGDPLRIAEMEGMVLAGDGYDLLPVIFPDQQPQTVLWDRF